MQMQNKHQHGRKSGFGNLHKDWRTWAVVLVMLAAIAAYVLTLDDSTIPGPSQASRGQAAAPARPAP